MKATHRIQNNHIMTEVEKNDFVKIIRKMPWLYQPLIDALSSNIKTQTTLLDVACGDGYLLELISTKFPNIKLSGIDIDPYFINKAKEKYSFDFQIKDVMDFNKNYDIITCNLALHHFDKPSCLIEKLLNHTNKFLLLSDQLRPPTELDLDRRLEKRKDFVGNKEAPFYRKNERSSVLESYSKKEIGRIIAQTTETKQIKTSIKLVDVDYYERFVIVFEK